MLLNSYSSNLHNIHIPWDPSVKRPPDPIHIDLVTVCGATIPKLEYAWELDYHRSDKPMEILRSAVLNDLMQGKTRTDIVTSFLHFKQTLDYQNKHHPGKENEFLVATILNPPILV